MIKIILAIYLIIGMVVTKKHIESRVQFGNSLIAEGLIAKAENREELDKIMQFIQQYDNFLVVYCDVVYVFYTILLILIWPTQIIKVKN